jgi:hypothetical protein
MLSKGIALFLALVLLWSGIATQEPPQASGSPLTASSAERPAGPSGPGSVQDHHLDDLPSQVQGEAAADLPEQLVMAARSQGAAQPMPAAAGPMALAHGTPCLDGLLRPPCRPVSPA